MQASALAALSASKALLLLNTEQQLDRLHRASDVVATPNTNFVVATVHVADLQQYLTCQPVQVQLLLQHSSATASMWHIASLTL